MSYQNHLSWISSEPPPNTTVDDGSDEALNALAAPLCTGHPALPGEIATVCKRSDGGDGGDETPALNRCLSSAPISAIRLPEDLLATASNHGLNGARVMDSHSSFDLKTYFRKRKRNGMNSIAAKRNQIDYASHEGKSTKDMVVGSSLLGSIIRFPNFSETKNDAINDVRMILPRESSSHDKRETDSKLMTSASVQENKVILSDNSIATVSKNLVDKVQKNASPMEACLDNYSSARSLLGRPVEDSRNQANFHYKHPPKPLITPKGTHENFPRRRRVLTESLEFNKSINIPQESDQKFIILKDNSTRYTDNHNHGKENSLKAVNQIEQNLPQFDDFIIENEEGSGGYGTVYRAYRKSDGKMFAIKCPHAKAHKSHVNNELKMLERFGGRNSIVKYEGSLKNGDTECFVLEHIDHDRPEVLKKEIDILQLQWYSFYLFRALSFLHKQAVVHRDVKPGNFLFSRKLKKGVLVDFNLSVDLRHKYAVGKNETNRSIKKINPTSSARSSIIGVNSKLNIQAIDASTSTRNSSAERTKEPLPALGRKELISLVHDVMQSPNHDALKTPFSQRKRTASPPVKILYTGPMPLFSNRIPIAGSGVLKNKGDYCKQKREGPCFGTKGFRAPEVLFRSLHQGPKIDVWSAGVTILCLMIGRTPFTGEPEQNIKEIAKLRGSEDLWEVAKLHDRESSFPLELLEIKSLPAAELQSWCKTHTRRPEFLKQIPRSLFDLIDKCLTVNPRLRISAEEALQHNFFAP